MFAHSAKRQASPMTDVRLFRLPISNGTSVLHAVQAKRRGLRTSCNLHTDVLATLAHMGARRKHNVLRSLGMPKVINKCGVRSFAGTVVTRGTLLSVVSLEPGGSQAKESVQGSLNKAMKHHWGFSEKACCHRGSPLRCARKEAAANSTLEGPSFQRQVLTQITPESKSLIKPWTFTDGCN